MRLSAFFLVFLGFTSCATMQEPRTLAEVKKDWDCLRYEKGAGWNQVASALAEPDIAPIPDSGTDMSRNSRVFTGTAAIFYVERQEVEEGGKTRFREVVTGLDLCKRKK